MNLSGVSLGSVGALESLGLSRGLFKAPSHGLPGKSPSGRNSCHVWIMDDGRACVFIVCIYACLPVCLYVSMHVYVYMYVHLSLSLSLSPSAHARACVCVLVGRVPAARLVNPSPS